MKKLKQTDIIIGVLLGVIVGVIVVLFLELLYFISLILNF